MTLALTLAAAVSATAQVTQSYDAQVKQGVYTEITDGTAIALGEPGDDFSTAVYDGSGTPLTSAYEGEGLPIGFDFKYDNQLVNRFVIGAHGYLVLGKDKVSATATTNPSLFHTDTDNDVLGFCYRSEVGAIASTQISYKLTGEAGQRELTVQYKDLQLYVDFWGEKEVRDTVQLQIRLSEATGAISFITSGFEPCGAVAEEMNYNDGFRLGIRGQEGDFLMKAGSFADDAFSTETNGYISWHGTSFPTDGLTYTFLPPEDCSTPTAQATALTATSTSTSLSGSFTPTDGTDHYLTLISQKAALDQLPTDGITYAEGDSIGSAHVLGYSAEASFATGDMLSAATTYYIYVLSANSYCFYGPKYNTASPLTLAASTSAAAPSALSLATADSTTLTVNVKANDAGNDVLVAYTTQPNENDWGQYTQGGAFGTPTGSYSAGDSILGGGRVAYAGTAQDGITIAGLKPSTVYHLTAWSRSTDGNYSTTTVDLDASTAITLPWTADFSQNAAYAAPDGWATEGSWQVESSGILLGHIDTKDGRNGVKEWVETPDVYLPEGENRLVLNLLMTNYTNHFTSAYVLNRKDTIRVQLTEDGESYTTVAEYGKQNPIKFADESTYTKLYIPFKACAGKKAKVRLYFHLFEAPTVYIDGIRLEQRAECDYPIYVTVADSTIVGNKATVSWTPQSAETAWDVRYKKTADEAWSEPITSNQPALTLTSLESMTNYDVQVRARQSDEVQSTWSETATFTSGLAVPFAVTFDQLESLPSSWKALTGELDTPTTLTDGGGWEFYNSTWMGTALSYSSYSAGADDWIVTPAIDLGDGTTAHEATFALSTSNLPDDTDATLQLVVARDGSTFNKEDVAFTVKADEMPEAYGDPKSFTASLKGFTGQVKLGFYVHATTRPFSFTLDTLAVNATGDEPTAIHGIHANGATRTTVYTLDGRRATLDGHGTFIVRTESEEGTTVRKIRK